LPWRRINLVEAMFSASRSNVTMRRIDGKTENSKRPTHLHADQKHNDREGDVEGSAAGPGRTAGSGIEHHHQNADHTYGHHEHPDV
jgi:hypothetical protein